MAGRIIGRRLPCCPGRDSRYTIRHHPSNPQRWWVHYETPSGARIPADEPHQELIALVNELKAEMAGAPGGGAFSINEYGQVIARTRSTGSGQAIHVVNVNDTGVVSTYNPAITFHGGQLDPRMTLREGETWTGPLSGMTYRLTAPGNPQAPSRKLDEIFTEVEGAILQVSQHGGIEPYPPVDGPLAAFLLALRRQLPQGGRFRVNEHRRAFTSNGSKFVGTIPSDAWFRPLSAES